MIITNQFSITKRLQYQIPEKSHNFKDIFLYNQLTKKEEIKPNNPQIISFMTKKLISRKTQA